MTMETRLYVVQDNVTGEKNFVMAKGAGTALSYIARTTLSVRLASAFEALKAGTEGVQVHDARKDDAVAQPPGLPDLPGLPPLPIPPSGWVPVGAAPLGPPLSNPHEMNPPAAAETPVVTSPMQQRATKRGVRLPAAAG